MSTPASCLLSRLQSAYRRAGQPPLHCWGYWPGTRSEASAIGELVAAGLLVEHRGAWTLTEKAVTGLFGAELLQAPYPAYRSRRVEPRNKAF